MDSKREGVGALFDDYVMSKTRLVDTQDFSTVNAPKKRGRKRKILTEQEALEKKRDDAIKIRKLPKHFATNGNVK